MGRPRNQTPTYRKHKQSGQAIVTLTDAAGNRHDKLLGKYGSKESRLEYARVIAEWESSNRNLLPTGTAATDLTVNELLLAYWQHVQAYYRHPDGRPTSEVATIKLVLRRVRELYGPKPVAAFDGLALEAVRNRMIGEDLCRTRINKDVSRIRRMFRWATAKNLVPVSVFQTLQTVEGLRAGRSEAKEMKPIGPVSLAVVEATLPFLRAQTRAMVQLQLLAGMRPGEVAVMRTCDLDMSGKVWIYRPGSDQGPAGRHKNSWRGQQRIILIGPRGQELLRPWLRLNLQEYLFQPKEARAAFDGERKERRQVPVRPSDLKRQRKQNPKKTPGEFYPSTSYCWAIYHAVDAANKARACESCKTLDPEDRCQACQAAAIPYWAPNQLRHAKATEIRKEAGLDAARVVLGHKSPIVTEVYAELDTSKAAEVMERLG